MNKKIETIKIQVKNGPELITKAQAYKNSGGEWKLRERYTEHPFDSHKISGHRKNTQPENSNYPLWIGIGVIGILIIGLITYFLVHKKKK